MRMYGAIIVACLANGPVNAELDHTPCEQSEVVLYCPGDAYFHTRLSAEQLRRMPKSGELSFSYASPFYTAGYFQATSGFRHAVLSGVTSEFIAGLKQSYSIIRENRDAIVRIGHDADGNEYYDEINGVHLFIVDKKFPLDDCVLGLRYNKQWGHPPAEATEERSLFPQPFGVTLPYQSLIRGERAVILDWWGSTIVPSLQADVPARVKWAQATMDGVETPVRVRVDDARVFILESDDVNSYMPPIEDRRAIGIHEITNKGIMRMFWDKEKRTWSSISKGGMN